MSHMEPYTLAQYHDAVKFNGSFGLSMSRLEATMQDYARLKHEELRLISMVAHLRAAVKHMLAVLPYSPAELVETGEEVLAQTEKP